MQEAMPQRNAAVPVNRRLQFRMGINLGEISPTKATRATRPPIA
jgi:hypothetical protein